MIYGGYGPELKADIYNNRIHTKIRREYPLEEVEQFTAQPAQNEYGCTQSTNFRVQYK